MPNLNLNKLFRVFIICIIIFCFSLQINANNEVLIKFAHLSDTHLDLYSKNKHKRQLGDSKQLLSNAISYINKQSDLNFAIFSGDMVNSATESSFSTFINMANNLKIRWLPVFGNHDVAVKSKYTKQSMLNLLKQDKPYYIKKLSNKVMGITLDGTTDKVVSAHGYFDIEQLKWLESELKRNKTNIIILALHFPIIPPGKSATHFIIEQDRQKLLSILKNYPNIAMVLSGHYHMDKISKLEGVIHVSSPALVEFPNTFRIISIHNNAYIGLKNVSVSLKNPLGKEEKEVLIYSERIEKLLKQN